MQGWMERKNWCSAALHTWEGVEVDGNRKVVALRVQGLTGVSLLFQNSSIGKLTALKTLSLTSDALQG
jgi:hypothetical protein